MTRRGLDTETEWKLKLAAAVALIKVKNSSNMSIDEIILALKSSYNSDAKSKQNEDLPIKYKELEEENFNLRETLLQASVMLNVQSQKDNNNQTCVSEDINPVLASQQQDFHIDTEFLQNRNVFSWLHIVDTTFSEAECFFSSCETHSKDCREKILVKYSCLDASFWERFEHSYVTAYKILKKPFEKEVSNWEMFEKLGDLFARVSDKEVFVALPQPVNKCVDSLIQTAYDAITSSSHVIQDTKVDFLSRLYSSVVLSSRACEFFIDKLLQVFETYQQNQSIEPKLEDKLFYIIILLARAVKKVSQTNSSCNQNLCQKINSLIASGLENRSQKVNMCMLLLAKELN